jgi:hypothetical protein
MWFRVLSLVIGMALIGKAIVALIARRRFYATRQTQYASETLPAALLFPPVVVVVMALLAWHATLFHYQPWGWIVTVFLTALSCMSVQKLVRWASHRQTMLKTVTSPHVWKFDCFLIVAGIGFVALALLVY